MNICLHGRTKKANAKYCSRACANCVNERLFPSRKRLARSCKHCGVALLTRRTTCDGCNPGFVDWQKVQLQVLKSKALQQ